MKRVQCEQGGHQSALHAGAGHPVEAEEQQQGVDHVKQDTAVR